MGNWPLLDRDWVYYGEMDLYGLQHIVETAEYRHEEIEMEQNEGMKGENSCRDRELL